MSVGTFQDINGLWFVASAIQPGNYTGQDILGNRFSFGPLAYSLPTALTNGQLIIGSTGVNPVAATLTQGATNGVTVTNGAGSITLDTAQDIRATASPTFNALTLTTLNGTAFSGTFTGAPTFSGNIAFTGTPTFSNALALGSSTATTQTALDNSTKIATDAYVDAKFMGTGATWFKEDWMSGGSTTVNATIGISFDTAWFIAPITGGTTGTGASAAGTIQNPGQYLVTTPAVSGQGIGIYGGSAGTFGPLGSITGWIMDAWVVLPATITNYCVRVGVVLAGQQLADPPTAGMYWEYDTANTGNTDTKWTLVSRNASTSSYQVSLVTPTASHVYHLRIQGVASGQITGSVGDNNGALGANVTNITTNVNTAGAMLRAIHVIPRTTAAVTLLYDAYNMQIPSGRV